MKWRLLVAVVLLVVAAFLPMKPAATWASGDAATGAPAVAPGPDSLVDARRAAGEAAAQASLLTSGTGQLNDGVVKLDEGSAQLIDGVAAAHSGAQELSNGMVELQAGTGQLAGGATQVADTVGGIVDQVVGFEAVRGQVIAAIDTALERLKDSKNPDVAAARDALTGLRSQAQTAQLPGDAVAQLNQLKAGSREVANQLSVPGYAYHDGIYSATNGAASLASGLGELNNGAGQAREGVSQLRDGSGKLDEMAQGNAQKIDAVRRALPAPTPVAGSAGSAGSAGEAAPSSALAPLAAMLIAALVTLTGFALAAAAVFPGGRRWWVVASGAALITAVGFVLVMVLGVSMAPAALATCALALALATLAAAGLTWMLMSSFGNGAGIGAAAAISVAEIGLVGWAWKQAAGGNVPAVVESASSAMPMHWLTAALSAAGNGGSATALWVGIGLSAAVALLGVVGLNRPRA
ncbi:hypothetical protein [Corynebacterium liangguodongii]|uniref:Uncharacterized protein n=1 Tax=Corynebacterium liangguodongii TaxID=2079535 RepID=A0A2S0WBS3_9CORY|nr:hypothetical protein [Corynebacterium liangguodongii]AWB83213.1 hypothetical protein C3E79_00875 [Corynebacterium liangguodongii]PWB98808.1 hypothetical protein DF219_10335 [Corynebacterium liangguodongii]